MSASTKSSSESGKLSGPSGFIQVDGNMFVVDYGRIFSGSELVGHLSEDGFLAKTKGALGDNAGVRPIEQLPGFSFTGIDANGLELILTSQITGPTGRLTFGGKPLNVVNGRICTDNHKLAGAMDDEGQIYLRDVAGKEPRRKLDETSLLNLEFSGRKSTGEAVKFEHSRAFYKPDKAYFENEIIRYFQDFAELKSVQKKYVIETMKLWASCGLLQVVRKSEGNAALGNVKHGAAGVTGVRTGYVTLDKDEFEKEQVQYYQHGAAANFWLSLKPYIEARLNILVAHEFGHQLEFVMSRAAQDRFTKLYESRKAYSEKMFPRPKGYEGENEILPMEQIEKRAFISGYSKSSPHEYWAEAVAAFSVKDSRDLLAKIDPAIYEMLMEMVKTPENLLSPMLHDGILALRASLRLTNDWTDELTA